MPNPSPHPINTVGHVYIQIFFQVLTLYRVGGGELQENFIKVALYHEGTQKLQKILNTALLSEGLLSMIVGGEKMWQNSFN